MDRRGDRSLAWFVAVGVVLVILGWLTLTGWVGLILLPLGVALLIGAAFGRRRWIVVGLVAGAVAFSAGYLLTAPLTCSETAGTGSGRRPVVVTTCSRVTLADLDREPRPADYLLAVSFAAGAAVVVGAGIALLASRIGGSTR
jgi:hypothetical protein